MRDDVTRFGANIKSRLGGDKISGNIKLCVGKITRLTEEDIPGASLRGRNPQQLTIPELKRWLSCRKGAKTNGKKRDLVER